MASFNPDGSIQTSDGRLIFADDPVTVGEFAELSKLLVPQKAGLWPFAHGGGGASGFVASGGGGGGQGGGGNGAQGAQGSQGAQGPGVGAQGAQGSQGSGGAQGTAGAQGSQGTIGAQGATGTGAQGAQGTGGAQGSQGTIGAQGAQGTGAQGAQGAQGSSSGGGGLFENNQSNTVGTTNATPTVVVSETIAALSVATFRAVIDARYNDGSQHASFVKTIRVHREGGGAMLGVQNDDYTDDSSLALTVNFTVSGNDIQVTVIGVAATNITWKVRMGRVILP